MSQNEKTGIVVGLTGQSGAGKSVVSNLLVNRGYRVIDADLVARDVVEKGEQCLLDLAIEFGIEILNADGTLNRRKLAEIAFSDKDKCMKLNQITHPYILKEINIRTEKLLDSGEPVVFLDAPTLFESGTDALCDKIVSIIAAKDTCLSRIISRDKLTPEEAHTRMGAQHEDKFYTGRSDFVIENNSDFSALRVSVMEMLDKLGIVTYE